MSRATKLPPDQMRRLVAALVYDQQRRREDRMSVQDWVNLVLYIIVAVLAQLRYAEGRLHSCDGFETQSVAATNPRRC